MSLKRIGAGNRMSEAVIHNGMVYLAGMVAETTVGKSVKEQTKDILSQIDDVLKQAGSDKTKIVKANIWLTDIKTWAEMNEAWDAWVVTGPDAGARHGRIEARGPRPRCRDHGRSGDLVRATHPWRRTRDRRLSNRAAGGLQPERVQASGLQLQVNSRGRVFRR